MRVSKVLIELDRAGEKLQGCFVLFLQAVAIAHDAPCFGRKQRLLKCKVAQVGELVLLLEVPEAGRVVLETFKAVGLDFCHLFVG